MLLCAHAEFLILLFHCLFIQSSLPPGGSLFCFFQYFVLIPHPPSQLLVLCAYLSVVMGHAEVISSGSVCILQAGEGKTCWADF